jgi:uncharacterized protein YmfQ (DUF2313 family)
LRTDFNNKTRRGERAIELMSNDDKNKEARAKLKRERAKVNETGSCLNKIFFSRIAANAEKTAEINARIYQSISSYSL